MVLDRSISGSAMFLRKGKRRALYKSHRSRLISQTMRQTPLGQFLELRDSK